MANVIFETATAAQAAAFTSSDNLIFNTTSPNQLAATYTAASGTTAATITLTNGTQTLTFAANSLKADGTNEIFGNGGTALFGTAGDDTGAVAVGTTPGTVQLTSANTGDNPSAAFTFAGVDSIIVGGKGANLVDAGAGNDTITFTNAAADTGAYVIQGGAGADSIVAGNSLGNLHIYGNLLASTAGDTDGNDVITVNKFTNYVNGNGGDDTISVATGGTGTNRLFGGGGNDIITGGDGIDSINGNAGADTLSGGLGNDYVRGGQGNDVVYGDATAAAPAAAAIIVGTTTNQLGGNDVLFGDVGDDTITGGVGIDVLTGGTGADRFIFNYTTLGTGTAAVSDAPLILNSGALKGFVETITDFSHADGDKIDLVGVDTNHVANIIVATGATFTDAFAAQSYASSLLASSSSSAINHDIVAVQVGNDTYIFSDERDTAAAAPGQHGTADTAIKLTGVTATALVASDFI